jgi:hypothetical protein
MLATEQKVFRPNEIRTLEDTGLSQGLVLDLVLKAAYFEGTVTLARLGQRLALNPTIIHMMYRLLQREQLCDTRAMVGNDYEISLTSRGRGLAEVALKKSQYCGPAPVPLAVYSKAASAQAVKLNVTADSLRRDLSDLVVPDHVINELGAALMTGGAIVLYGATGNGKSSLAERLPRVFDDFIYVPHAVEVSGQIVTVFDPLVHHAEDDESVRNDPRWVRCRRPMVKVGGEMRAEMLDASMDEVTRICAAPLQMKANNGILLIDDFGRQRISPRELLNRWIVPLDRGMDILSLSSGISFEIPFELIVVFATNLSLSDLAEDAFIRRLKNKIKIEPLGEDLFKELLQRVCTQQGVPWNPETGDYMIRECLKHSPDGLRACFPRDLLNIICGMAAFQRRQPTLQQRDVDEALRVYFVH